MRYKFFSTSSGDGQHQSQWQDRSIDGELAAFDDRTLVAAFNKYISFPHSKVIEAGCGLGAWCEWFRRKGCDVIGLEYFEDVVKQAKMNQPDIPVEVGDVTNIKYGDNSFDVYVSLGVIEHFEGGPEKALSEAYRVLKPDGIAFITVPVLTPMRKYLAHPIRDVYFLRKRLLGHKVFFWEYRYSPDELRSFIEKAGFSIIEEGVDDYEEFISNRHIGIWADWFFLRQKNGDIWELNTLGSGLLQLCKYILPASWYCSGWLVVARANKNCQGSI